MRLIFADLNGNGRIDQTTGKSTNEILQENHYYPFGMTHYGSYSTNTGVGEENRYRYNGKELNEDLGLYDYGARFYDPTIARWTSIDPLAEIYSASSPYAYVVNNPINFIDPDRMSISVGLDGTTTATGKDAQDLFRRMQDQSNSESSEEDGPIHGEDGRLIGYMVEPGQGPSQIAKDLNQIYGCELNCEINYQDIVLDNAGNFANVIDANGAPLGKWDEAYKSGNIDPGDVLLILYGTQSAEEVTLLLLKAADIQREIDSVSEIVARHNRINTAHEIFAEGLKWERGDRSSGATGAQIAISLRMFENVNDSVRADRLRSVLIRMQDSVLNKIEDR